MPKTLAEIAATLRARPPRVNARYQGPRAAVLLALTEDAPGGAVSIWLTLRAAGLRMNPGEVAFPGGKRDATDASDWDTALVTARQPRAQGTEHARRILIAACGGGAGPGEQREAHEEIGLDPATVTFVAQLDGLMSRFGLLVTPFVATVPWSFRPRVNPREVDVAFRVPLATFVSTNPAVHRSMVWEEDNGDTQLSHMFTVAGDLDGGGGPAEHLVWGLTASMLLHLLEASAFAPLPYEVSLPGTTSWFDRTLLHGASSDVASAEGPPDRPAATAPDDAAPPRSRL